MDQQHLVIIVNHLNKNEAHSVKNVIATLKQSTPLHKISLVYVRPYIAAHCHALPSMVDFLDTQAQRVREQLRFWGNQLNISDASHWTTSGNVYIETMRFIKQFNADYILTHESIKRHFNHRIRWHHDKEPTLLRSFDHLFLFENDHSDADCPWQHSALAHAMM